LFCYAKAKAKNVTPEIAAKNPHTGDAWIFTGIDADTKLIPCWLIGPRDGITARIFVNDLAAGLANRIQLTTDGHSMYLQAVEGVFHGDVDFAQLVKLYGNDPEAEKRYSPSTCIDCERKVTGNPDPDLISTSYVERANVSMRMGMRRFTRPTNVFSKKIENRAPATALAWTIACGRSKISF
jgi:IS1 family transposase